MLLPLSRGGTGSRGPPERCAGSSRPSAVHCRAGQGLTPAGESGAPGALGQRLTAKGMKATQGGGLAPRRGVGELHAVRQFPNPEAPAGGLLPPATPSAPAGCRAERARDGPRGHTSVLSPVTATGKDPDQGQTARPAVRSLATGQAGAQGGGSSPRRPRSEGEPGPGEPSGPQPDQAGGQSLSGGGRGLKSRARPLRPSLQGNSGHQGAAPQCHQ